MKSKGMWIEQADQDAQILEAAERIMRRKLDRIGKISEPSEAGSYLRAHCGHAEREVFGCIFLDTRHRILSVEDLFFGTIDGAEVHPGRWSVGDYCLTPPPSLPSTIIPVATWDLPQLTEPLRLA